MFYGDGFSCVSLEDPWRRNRPNESCIPSGSYVARKRLSPKRGYNVFELVDVPERLNIQIHKGNTSDDTEGCILIGEQFEVINQQLGILNSKSAFDRFMEYLDGVSEIEIEVI